MAKLTKVQLEAKVVELTARVAELEAATKKAAEHEGRDWTAWVGKPSEKQSKWTERNLVLVLKNEGKVVAMVHGFKVGKNPVVGGFRPKLMVPNHEGFEFARFCPEEKTMDGFPFSLTYAERLAAWALKQPGMDKYPVRFPQQDQPKPKAK
jgi:hypothetical protein